MPTQIDEADLTPEMCKALGVVKTREQRFSVEGVRPHAIKVLAAIAGLTRDERERVLKHALKLNKV